MKRTLLIVGCLLPFMAYGQSDRGVITGTLSDPAGAVVAGAPVEARNVQTGITYPVASSTTGNYTVSQLPPGVYEITVTVPGFKRYTRGGLQVQVAQTLRVDVLLEVGAASESVTVTEAAALLKTESGELSHNVEAGNLNSLPILGIGGTQSGASGIRNPNAVVRMIPGAYWEPNANVRVNGAPMNTQSYRIEGQESQNTGTSGVPQQNQPSVDAIQEMAIQTSNFAAEFGQVGGGYFNITMKSGTNQYHGSGYNYMVNEALNAGTPFTNNGQGGNIRPRERRNDYGFTIGGPLWIPKLYNGRDKTFFFVNWEQYRETRTINNLQQTVPIPEYRAGNFGPAITTRVVGDDPLGRQMLEGMIFDPNTTRLVNGRQVRDQFPANTIPTNRFDPISVKVQSLVPLPLGPTAGGLSNNFIRAFPSARVTEIPSFKIDQQIGSQARVSFYWQNTYTGSALSLPFGQPDGFPGPVTTAIGTYTSAPMYRLNYDHTLSPTLLLHLGAGWRQTKFNVPSVTGEGELTNYDAEKELGLRGQLFPKFFPQMQGMLATNGTGGLKNIGSQGGNTNFTQSPTFNASLSWVKNNHTYKFGSEFRTEGFIAQSISGTTGLYSFSAAQTGQPFQNVNAAGGYNVGFGYASFLLGQANSVTINNPVSPRIGKSQFGVYAQDTWKVTRKFTLDYGLRWDYSTYLQESYGRAPFFSPSTIHPRLGIPGGIVYDKSGPGRCNCNIANNYPWAFGPRLGAAYQITPKTVVRLGFGIVYSSTSGSNNAQGGLAGSSAATPTSAFGFPVTTLSQGIPVNFRPPAWPTFDAGQYPTSAPVPGSPGPGSFDQNAGRPARQYQWSVGVQREILRDLVVEAAYVANRGIWWVAPGLLNVNAIPQDRLAANGLSLANAADRSLLTSFLNSPLAISRGFGSGRPYPGFPATQTIAQSLRPFPQFTTINTYWPTLGKTWYDSLQVKATKRLSHGLTLLSTFTWSRSFLMGAEREPNFGTAASGVVNDVFNRANNKYLSGYDIPFQFIVSATYQTPRLNIGNRAVKWLLADWTVGSLLNYQSGRPIAIPQAQTNPNLNNLVYQTTYANRVPGEPLLTVPDLNCHCYDAQSTFVLNPRAWANPAPGEFGGSAIYYTDYRTQRRPVENLNFGRTFRITERVQFNVRAEFANIFNRAFWNDPTATNAQALQQRRPNGTTLSGFGFMSVVQAGAATNIAPRNGVIVARVTF